MREIKVGRDGVVPILDTKKLYIMEVYFRERNGEYFCLEPHYYVCVIDNDGITSFVKNSTTSDIGFVSDSIQKSVKRALVEIHSNYLTKIYEFNNAQEFEKEKNVKLCVGIKN